MSDFEQSEALVRPSQRFAGGFTDTGALGAPDSERELILYGENFRVIGTRRFVGYQEAMIDGRSVLAENVRRSQAA